MILSGEDTAAYVENIVHLETQQADYGIDLTVDALFRITGEGALDFGGSEFEQASRRMLEPELAKPGNSYGWWTLEEGSYIVRFNESLQLSDDVIARIEPLERLLQTGVTHASQHLGRSTAPIETLLIVGSPGVQLKENCRISRLLVSR
jgi:deoxycytidine triphosphate deaminase